MITFLIAGSNVMAQTVLTGGFGTDGMGIVNGNTYSKTGTLGSGGFPFVSASKDGSKFFASAINIPRLYFINVSTMSFVDSMDIFVRNLASSNEDNILFTINDKSLIRINTSTKSVDSIVLGAPWLLEERPNAKEVWVSDSGKIHIVDYTTGLTSTTIQLTSSPYDYGGVRFTPGGTIGYKTAGTSKKIYKINAATKVVLDSVTTSYSPGVVVVSHDSSKIFVTNAGAVKIMVHNASTLALIDSIDCGTRAPMNLYRHPDRAEIWAVNHFNDSISVYNENTNALITAFNCSGSPWYIAFSNGTTGVKQMTAQTDDISIFPNPASDKISITMPGNSKRKIEVIDNVGRVLMTQFTANGNEIINVADFAPGVYYILVEDETGTHHSLSFMKQ